MNIKKTAALMLFISLMAGTASCNLPSSSSETEADLNVTQAYQTVEARLTEGVAQTPLATQTNTPTRILTATPTSVTPTAAVTNTPNQPTGQSSPVSNCDLAAAGNPIDVTIPDDTQLQPGEAFTKVWRLQNAGTCTWDQNYALALFSGEGMGAITNIQLEGQVPPNDTVDISVDLIAPDPPGTYQGYWKLRNELGEWFGIGPNGGSAFWVRVIVGDEPVSTLSDTEVASTQTSEPSVTDTPGPAVYTSGPVSMQKEDGLDLDSKNLNNAGVDLLWREEADLHLFLESVGSAGLAFYEFVEPSLEDCKSISFDQTRYYKREIKERTYFCYITNEGRYGWLKAISWSEVENKLSLQILTWTAP